MKELIGKKITVRPNLHTGWNLKKKPLTTIHSNRLGKSEYQVFSCSIRCTGTVVRPSGQRKAELDGDKTVHAGLVGFLIPTVDIDPFFSRRVEYNPHKGDKFFHINGDCYDGGGVITAIGHLYYLVE